MVGAESIVGIEAEETLASDSCVGCVGGSDALGAEPSWTGVDSMAMSAVGAPSCPSLATKDFGCFEAGLVDLKNASIPRERVRGKKEKKRKRDHEGGSEKWALLLYVLRAWTGSLGREKGEEERRRDQLGHAPVISWAENCTDGPRVGHLPW